MKRTVHVDDTTLLEVRKVALQAEVNFVNGFNAAMVKKGNSPWIPGKENQGKFAAAWEEYLLNGKELPDE